MKNNINNILFILILTCFGIAGDAVDGIKPGMVQVHGGTLFWSVITFIILLVVLKKVAWSPIIEGLETRESEIKEALHSAQTARENADKASKDYESLVNKARAESQEIISASKITAERLKEEIKESAKKEASELMEKSKANINSERDKALNEIRSVVIDLSIQVASKVIEKNLDSDDNKRIINDAIKDIGKA